MRTRPGKFWMVLGSGEPHVRHRSRDVAEAEADRLARAHPGVMFVVLEALTMHRRIDVERVELAPADPHNLPDDLPF